MTSIRTCVLIAAFAGLLFPACRKAERSANSQSATQPSRATQVVLSTPQDAARSVMACLRTLREARQRQDAEAITRGQEQLRSVAAREVILRRFEEALRRPARDPDAEIDNFVQGWAATVGFYLEGVQLDAIRAPEPGPGVNRMDVHVAAAVGGASARIRVECQRGADRKWRVARIDFEPATAATRPTTSPVP